MFRAWLIVLAVLGFSAGSYLADSTILVVRAAEGPQSKDSLPALTAEQKTKLRERDGLVQQVEQLSGQGKYPEALAPAVRALALTREVRGDEHVEVAEGQARVAELQELTGDFAAGVKSRRLVLAVRTKLDGEKHWRTGDARRALSFAVKLAGLKEEQQAKMVVALRKEQEAVRLEGQDKYAEAEGPALAVLEVFGEVRATPSAEAARVWHLLGRTRMGRKAWEGAKEANERAVEMRRAVLEKVHPDLGRSLNNLGLTRQYQSDLRGAQRHLEEAVGIWRMSLGRDDLLTAMGLNNLAIVQEELRDYAAAQKSYQEALAIRRKALPKDHPKIADSLNTLGNLQYALQDFAAAQKSHEEALAIRRKALPKDHPDIAHSLNNLGIVQDELRDYAASQKSHEEALAIRRKALPKDHPDIADSLYNLGNVQYALRDYATAQKSYEEALAIRRKALPKDHPKIADSLYNLGNVQEDLRDYAAAQKSYEEALAIYRKALPKDHPNIAMSLNNLGVVQYDLRDYAAAQKNYEEALAIRREALSKDHPNIAMSLNNLGIVQSVLRDYAAARKSYEEVLAIYRKALPKDHPDIAAGLNNLGIVQEHLRDYAAAQKSHQEALAIRRKALPKDHPDIAMSLNNLGIVHYDLRDYAAAQKSYEEALAIQRNALPKDHPKIAMSLNNLGYLSCLSGIGLRKAVLDLAEATDLKHAEQVRLAVLQAEQEQFTTAADTSQCLNLLLSAALTTQADADPIYARVVRVKGAVTTQQHYARKLRDTKDPETVRLLGRFRAISQELTGLSVANQPRVMAASSQDVVARVRALSRERAELERQLSARSAVYRTLQNQTLLGSGDIRAALGKSDDVALLDFVDYLHVSAPSQGQKDPSFEQRLIAFVVRPGQKAVTVVALGPSKVMTERIDRWRASYGMGKMPLEGKPDPAAELREHLWQPLVKHLNGVKVVLVSPDGPLHGLPFAALPGTEKGRFLVHDYAFATVPVPQLLPQRLRSQPRPAQEQPSLLLAGGIDFGKREAADTEVRSGKLPPLPLFGALRGAESEVNDLRAQFEDAFPDAAAPKSLRKDKATKQAVLAAAPAYRFVHLATHGFFAAASEKSALEVAQRAALQRDGMRLRVEASGRHPGLLSGVVFAGVNRVDRRPEDTILTSLEASELELGKVELVVLSACETGRGQVAGGEGVLGLQRAFQLSGARSVVASLWNVSDEETHQLMREFYRRVWSEKAVSKAEALRQAQLWMLDNWKPRGNLERQLPISKGPPPPYFWAAFVLSGDWR